jgi:hypothetical protein
MAASIPVEEEHGTFTTAPRRHNGYYAGDFSVYPADRRVAALHTTAGGRRQSALVLSR